MTVQDDLIDAGFELVGSRSGTERFARRSNPYLQWWVVVSENGAAELQWEFALGEYLKSKGFHISAQDELSLLLFPGAEVRGPADAGWIADEIIRAESQLASVNLASGE